VSAKTGEGMPDWIALLESRKLTRAAV
jgi:hypothetical protein